MNHLLLLALLALTAHCFYIPLKPNRARCLSEYLLGGSASTLKLKVGFPKLDNQQPGEHYTASFRNTETNETKTDIIHPGDKYVREVELDKSNTGGM
jgi:hypothetical protein